VLGSSAQEACGGAEALALLAAGQYRTLLLDRSLPDLDADELVGMVRARHPQMEVLVLGPDLSAAPIGEGPRLPSDASELFRLLQNSCTARIPSDLPAPVLNPLLSATAAGDAEPLPGMLGSSASLRRVYRLVRLVAPRQTTVLLTGETGTGKELVARALHALSPRRERPFVVVNCAAIPEPLFEAELFGYNRGAFTGAFQSRLGRLQLAQSGTVFLDEIGDFPASMQAKLLRFLQDGEVQRLGSPDSLRVDARVVAATNANLARLVKEGRFREDLYYRLSVFPIEIEPLRRRREDIAPLANHFLDSFCQEAHVPAKAFSPQALGALEQYSWPGNVRELGQAVERAFILAEEQIELRTEHLFLGMGEPFSEGNLRRVA
jgi:transcriptional regulator with GAF, ATPase, and Fis domain